MRTRFLWLLVSAELAAAGCGDEPDPAPAVVEVAAAPRRGKQVTPPIDLKAPPAGASKTGSGLRYTRLVTRGDGEALSAGRTAVIRYTGWRQRTGETFFTTTERGIAIDPLSATPAFREALPLLRKGEKAMLWVPAAEGSAEPVVYEIELIDVVAPSPQMAEKTAERAAGGGASGSAPSPGTTR